MRRYQHVFILDKLAYNTAASVHVVDAHPVLDRGALTSSAQWSRHLSPVHAA